jgi:flagella synthesis protein FlgN
MDALLPEPAMPANSLLPLFHEDIGITQTLLELIGNEFEALTGRDLEHLNTLLSQKQQLLTLLAQHTDRRTQLLLDHQLTPDRAGLQRLAAQTTDGDALLQAGDTLAELIEQCKAGNLRNGRLIRANQGSLEQSLSILRGSEAPSLYNSKGSADRPLQMRPLNKV